MMNSGGYMGLEEGSPNPSLPKVFTIIFIAGELGGIGAMVFSGGSSGFFGGMLSAIAMIIMAFFSLIFSEL